jgi:SAM-dependent methyltransferase
MSRSFPSPRPVEPAWQAVLEGSLGRVVAPRPLAVMVERLSARYRGEAVNLAHADEMSARALFWFPRDLPKVHRAVAELAHAQALPARPLRVLDLGAGLGATFMGFLRALPVGVTVAEVTAVDRDPQALEILARVAKRAGETGVIPAGVTVHTLARDLAAEGWDEGLGTFDVILAGLSLVELAQASADTESSRGAVIAERVQAMLPHLADDGALILLEPGNRHETRALHHARDGLVTAGVTVFAPCLTSRPCPMLQGARDWCHEDLPDISLPAWLVPIAKLAGLRWEGLTWSYLVLRRDDRTLARALHTPGVVPLRVVSNILSTKGKAETWLCGARPHEGTLKVMELEREAKRAKHPTFETLARGDLVGVAEETLPTEAGKTVRLTPGGWSRLP